MNSLKRSNTMKYAALAVLAVALGSGLANAQVSGAGKFNLPFTTHWGQLVLTPGPYSFIYYHNPIWTGCPVVVVRRGTRSLGFVLARVSQPDQRFTDPSHLTAVLTGGGYRISSLQLSDQGITLRFRIPKSEILEASQTKSSRNVPILRASN
jgi:hypothetical protein